MTGYCMKCKSNKEMQNEEKVITKNNNSMVKGICKDCGTKMCLFQKKSRV